MSYFVKPMTRLEPRMAPVQRIIDGNPTGADAVTRQTTFEFILIDAFSMVSVVTAIEPLRVANRILGEERYVWHVTQEAGAPPEASNGLSLPTQPIQPDDVSVDYTFLCAGMHTHPRDATRLYALLNRRYAAGKTVGAVSLAPAILARAGLLKDKRCVIHWEGLGAFVEEFPHVEILNGLFEIDGRVITSSGGLAMLDLFLDILKRDQESWLVQAVSNQLQIGQARSGSDRQSAGQFRLPVTAPRMMHKALAVIDQTLAAPLSPDVLADQIGTSRRTLDRRFQEFTQSTVAEFYRARRLEQARGLLRYSNISILDVALSTGFPTASYFSSLFKSAYGLSPKQFRKAAS